MSRGRFKTCPGSIRSLNNSRKHAVTVFLFLKAFKNFGSVRLFVRPLIIALISYSVMLESTYRFQTLHDVFLKNKDNLESVATLLSLSERS